MSNALPNRKATMFRTAVRITDGHTVRVSPGILPDGWRWADDTAAVQADDTAAVQFVCQCDSPHRTPRECADYKRDLIYSRA